MVIFSMAAEYGVTISRDTAFDIVLFFDENSNEIENWKAGKTGCHILRFRQFWDNDNLYNPEIVDFVEQFQAMIDSVDPLTIHRIDFGSECSDYGNDEE